MKKILSLSLVAIYLMVPGNTFALADHNDDQAIDDFVTMIVENTS